MIKEFFEWELIAVFGSGLLTGLLIDLIKSPFSRAFEYAFARGMRWWNMRGTLEYQPETDGFFTINRWSPERELTEAQHEIRIGDDRPKPELIEPELLAELSRNYFNAGKQGPICYLTSYQIDHKESLPGEKFIVQVHPCDYSEHLATYELLSNNSELRARAKKALGNDIEGYISRACPANVTLNIIVLSEERFLAIKRSQVVETAKNQWTIGACETMMIPDGSLPGQPETLFSFARRALREELNLLPDQYGDIHFTWFGMSAETLGALFIAIVRIKKISEGEAIARAINSHSNFESTDFKWLKLSSKQLRNYILDRRSSLTKYSWISFAKLSMQEILRYKPFL